MTAGAEIVGPNYVMHKIWVGEIDKEHDLDCFFNALKVFVVSGSVERFHCFQVRLSEIGVCATSNGRDSKTFRCRSESALFT